MVGISCYILADTFFIATAQGTNGITALNLALPIYGIIFAIGSMIGTGSAIRYALAKATGQQEAKKYFSKRLWRKSFYCAFYIDISLLFMFLSPFTALFSAKCTDKNIYPKKRTKRRADKGSKSLLRALTFGIF